MGWDWVFGELGLCYEEVGDVGINMENQKWADERWPGMRNCNLICWPKK